MLASLEAKLIGLALVLAALAGLYLWGHHRGAADVQAQWDAAESRQNVAAANQRATSAQQTLDWTQQFSKINERYEEAAHAPPAPTIANAVATAAADGTLRLRNEPTCPAGIAVSGATVRARAADAAATQALADRVTAAIAAVRAGDDADARERQLGQQVTALQALLVAERQRSPTP